ncbi:hypothetical protein FPV67DRAFT_1163955 [Lyophyllum atratum]|nr:hypothetical protein FPV67DRAFT_1163955 [Lyophyllum atratum]
MSTMSMFSHSFHPRPKTGDAWRPTQPGSSSPIEVAVWQFLLLLTVQMFRLLPVMSFVLQVTGVSFELQSLQRSKSCTPLRLLPVSGRSVIDPFILPSSTNPTAEDWLQHQSLNGIVPRDNERSGRSGREKSLQIIRQSFRVCTYIEKAGLF